MPYDFGERSLAGIHIDFALSTVAWCVTSLYLSREGRASNKPVRCETARAAFVFVRFHNDFSPHALDYLTMYVYHHTKEPSTCLSYPGPVHELDKLPRGLISYLRASGHRLPFAGG